MKSPIAIPRVRFNNASGAPLAGGKLYTYRAGTTTPQNTWQDAAGTVANTNPINLDANGECVVWLDDTYAYDFALKDASMVTQPVPGLSVPSIRGLPNSLAADLASTASSAVGTGLVGWLRNATGAVATTLYKYLGWGDLNAFEFMTAAQIADIEAYSYSLDVSVPLQAAITAAWTKQRRLELPAGGYRCDSTLTIPGPANNYKQFFMRGAGTSNPFASGANGTRIKKTTVGRVLEYVGTNTPPSDIEIDVSGIYFWNSNSANTAAVVYLKGFYGQGQFHHNVFYQGGTGNGFECAYSATVDIHHNYAMNRDTTTFGLGAARVGIGFYIYNTNDAGLTSIHKCSSRGFHTSYKIGDAGPGTPYSTLIHHSECSVFYVGVETTFYAQMATISNMYMEGCEGGTGILNKGRYTQITNNQMFGGASVGIDLGPDTWGTRCTDNVIPLLGGTNNQTAIRIDTSGAYAGLGNVVSNNLIIYGGSGGTDQNVVGIKLIGVNPQVDMSGNVFNPNTAWLGGTGTTQFLDSSTSSKSAAGGGLHGFGVAGTRVNSFPLVANGAYGVGLDADVLTEANVTANVLTLTLASDFVMTATVATTVNSVAAPALEGKLFWIRATNANTTFANTVSLKMAGAANYTPGAGGASICFKYHANVAWEVSRVAY